MPEFVVTRNNVLIGTVWRTLGEVVEVDESDGAALVEAGFVKPSGEQTEPVESEESRLARAGAAAEEELVKAPKRKRGWTPESDEG